MYLSTDHKLWITPSYLPHLCKNMLNAGGGILVRGLLSYTSQTISIILRSEAGSACWLQYLSIKRAWDNREKWSGTAKST